MTTAAAVWETTAIGMAVGAGLVLLAVVVTALHFVIVLGYTMLLRRMPGSDRAVTGFRVVYQDGRGVLRDVLAACTERGWSVTSLAADSSAVSAHLQTLVADDPEPRRPVGVTLELSGSGAANAAATLAAVDGVVRVERHDDESE
ncbi:MAG: hypothetical protein ACRDQU_16865 [Pseudonocardiaceae bacterium]